MDSKTTSEVITGDLTTVITSEVVLQPPAEGDTIWDGKDLAGVVTSTTWSPTLGKSIMLGWLRLKDGQLPTNVTIEGRPARRAPTPFYDPEGRRARG